MQIVDLVVRLGMWDHHGGRRTCHPWCEDACAHEVACSGLGFTGLNAKGDLHGNDGCQHGVSEGEICDRMGFGNTLGQIWTIWECD